MNTETQNAPMATKAKTWVDLAKEVAELRKTQNRLDFLIKHNAAISRDFLGFYYITLDGNQTVGWTPEEAIDAAMELYK